MKSTSGLSICPRNWRAYADRDSTYRRWPSAKMVSNARLDFPEPDSPVNTIMESLGRSRDTSWYPGALTKPVSADPRLALGSYHQAPLPDCHAVRKDWPRYLKGDSAWT